MSIRRTLLVAAVAACAFAALPSVASAYFMDLPKNTEFTVASEPEEKTILRAGEETEVTCTSAGGSGSFTDKHSGSITLTFKGCKSAGTNCQSSGSGEKAGEIMTTTLPFDVVKVTHPEGVGSPGILITPKEGHFATFKCAFGLVTAEVKGNGVIGTLTAPAVGVPSNKFSFSFQEDGKKHQTHTTAHDTTEKVSTGTHYQLETSINGGGLIPSAQIGKGSITFNEGEGTLTGE